MSYWSRFPFTRLTGALISGILWAYHTPTLTLHGITSRFLLLTTIYFLTKRLFPLKDAYLGSAWVGSLGLASVFLGGALCLVAHLAQIPSIASEVQNPPITAYVAVATENAVKKSQHNQVTMRLQQAYVAGKWQAIQGKIRLSIHSAAPTITYGNQYLIRGTPMFLSPPKNPHEFNYKAFLGYEGIIYQHFVDAKSLQKIAHRPPNKLQAICLNLRRSFEMVFQKVIPNQQARSIALALVLGINDKLDFEIRNIYAQTGTMHILAVSGLHVGILYLLMSILIYRRTKQQHNNWPHALLMLTILWTYAGITGLSPATLRATLSAGLVLIARLIRKINNSYNLLAASAFILLLFNPVLLFSVSFQLSYTAVLGILYLYPKLYRWIKCKHTITQYIWSCTAMSLAAQLATAPISLYYFHQFPTYFIFANWIVVPTAFLIFVLGVTLLCTSWWLPLNSNIGWLIGKLIISTNQVLVYIQHLPGSTIQHIYLDKFDVGLWYIFLISVLVLCEKKRFVPYLTLVAVAFLLLTKTLYQHILSHRQQGVIFYSIPGHRAMLFIQGKRGILLTDEVLLQPEEHKKITYHIQPSQLAMGIHVDEQYSWKQVPTTTRLPLADFHSLKISAWRQRLFIFMDTNHWTPLQQKYTTDFLVLTGRKLPSLPTLQINFQFTYLILDTSVPKEAASQFVQEARQQGIPCHYLAEEGALQVFW